ncbi:MAG: Hsp20/alpha crystallin family protein [Saprospiraceae bacterium]|nr:Hsp20/alpha crystallin family protein [Saprospiraceae bacterium]
MTLVNVKPANGRTRFAAPAFDRIFDEFLRTDLPTFANGNGVKNSPNVNVVETADNFRIEVAAPGLEKGDFTVNVDKNVLTIAAKKEVKREEGEKVRKLEFSYSEFSRTFHLPETVSTDAIEAAYVNGILNVILPKKEEAKPKPARTIEIL